MSDTSTRTLTLDAAIIGGGVAGLWLLDRLRTSGYRAALFTDRALGEGQTLASQGMIHGGIKYTLSGALSGASEAIADMPDYWSRCLEGKGEVDLTDTRTLSDHFYMWSGSRLGKLTSFFASRAVRGRVEKVPAAERPELLQNPGFKGSLYRLVDKVIDVPSMLDNLARNNRGHVFQLADLAGALQVDGDDRATLVTDEGLTIEPRRLILTAGRGNEALLQALGTDRPAMQLRPLQQAVVRHHYPYAFYGHCLGADKTPRLTISSHPGADGKMVWYLGGQLAEKGASQSAQTVIDEAKAELAALFPWLDFSDADWSTLPIERAEPRQKGGVRPDQAFAEAAPALANVLVGWPTKLTLAPNLANQMLALMPEPADGDAALAALREQLPQPPVAPLPWEKA